MSVRLNIIAWPKVETLSQDRFILPAGVLSLGRAFGNDAMLPDQSKILSRHHAVVRVEDDGRVTITDTSANGTWVNNQEMVRDLPYRLTPGDKISLGYPSNELDDGKDKGSAEASKEADNYVIEVIFDPDALVTKAMENHAAPESGGGQHPPVKSPFSAKEKGDGAGEHDDDPTLVLIPELAAEHIVHHDSFEHLEVDFPSLNHTMIDPFEDADPMNPRALAYTSPKETLKETLPKGQIDDNTNATSTNEFVGAQQWLYSDPFDNIPAAVSLEDSVSIAPQDFADVSPVDPVQSFISFRRHCENSALSAFNQVIGEVHPDRLSPTEFQHRIAQGHFADQFKRILTKELEQW